MDEDVATWGDEGDGFCARCGHAAAAHADDGGECGWACGCVGTRGRALRLGGVTLVLAAPRSSRVRAAVAAAARGWAAMGAANDHARPTTAGTTRPGAVSTVQHGGALPQSHRVQPRKR